MRHTALINRRKKAEAAVAAVPVVKTPKIVTKIKKQRHGIRLCLCFFAGGKIYISIDASY